MSDCLVKGPFNRTIIYGIPAFNIAAMIIFTGIASKYVKIPAPFLMIPVAFILFKVFCINTIFFSTEKTGIVSSVMNK